MKKLLIAIAFSSVAIAQVPPILHNAMTTNDTSVKWRNGALVDFGNWQPDYFAASQIGRPHFCEGRTIWSTIDGAQELCHWDGTNTWIDHYWPIKAATDFFKDASGDVWRHQKFTASSYQVITVSSNAEKFFNAETVTQATSAASGTVIGLGDTFILVYNAGTAFDNSHLITGGTSGNTATPTAVTAKQGEYVLSKLRKNTTRIRQRSSSGYLQVGETVTQEGSGATGILASASKVNNYGATAYEYYILPTSGTFAAEVSAGDHTITGGTSGNTVEPYSYSVDRDGVCTNAIDAGVLRIVSTNELNFLTPQGNIISTGGNRKACAPHGNSQVWLSSDAGTNWTMIIDDNAVGTIRHFHSIRYWTNSVLGTELLTLANGDNNYESAVVFTTNVSDLYANPSHWVTNWGFSQTSSTNRLAWLQGSGAQYALAADGTQSSRAVGIEASDDLSRVYWISDGFDPMPISGLWTSDIATRTMRRIADTAVQGLSSFKLSNGTMLFQTSPWWVTNSTIVDYMNRVWQFDPVSEAVAPVTERALSTAFRWHTANDLEIHYAFEYWDNSENPLILLDEYALTSPHAYCRGWCPAEGPRMAGRFGKVGITRSAAPMTDLLASAKVASAWTALPAGHSVTVADETTIVDRGHNQSASLLLTPSATNEMQYMQYSITGSPTNMLRGQWVTLAFEAYGSLGSQTFGVIKGGTGVGPDASWFSAWNADPAYPNNKWFPVQIPWYIPRTVTELKVIIYVKLTGTGTAPVYISDPRLVVGNYAGALGNAPELIIKDSPYMP